MKLIKCNDCGTTELKSFYKDNFSCCKKCLMKRQKKYREENQCVTYKRMTEKEQQELINRPIISERKKQLMEMYK